MQVLLDIPQNNVPFVLELLDRLSLQAIPLPTKKLNPRDKKKAETLEGLRNAVEELNEITAGRKKARPAQELIDELRRDDTCRIRQTTKTARQKVPVAC